jgi:chromosomal replication initiation ATPase DnaA
MDEEELRKDLIEDASVLFEIVEQVTGITENQIKSRSRKRPIADARMMMSEALRRNSKYKLWEIGRVVSGLNHSSVLHYRGKVKDFCENDKSFKARFFDINVKFGQIKNVGLPLHKKLEFAVRERDRLNKDIRRMKKLLRL